MDVLHQCAAVGQCTQMRDLLLEGGAEDEQIESCPSGDAAWPCSAMVGNARLLYKLVSPRMASKTIRFVTDLFGDPAQVFKQNVKRLLAESPFHCPDIDIDIHQPCQVSSCEFFTPNRWTRNCILYYRVRHDRDLLSLNELAFLRHIDVNTLRSQINKTIKTLGHGALKETIVQEGVSSQVTHLKVDKICVVCEKSVASRGRQIVRSGLTYCSRACYRKKPPVVVGIEQDFGLPIKKVLELCVSKFASIKNMCGALNVGQGVFLDLCKRYDVDISSVDV